MIGRAAKVFYDVILDSKMIKTRKHDSVVVHGSGPVFIALTPSELELMGALLSLVSLGHNHYQEAALKLLNTIVSATGDPEFPNFALDEVMPEIVVLNDILDVVAAYGQNYTIEILV